MKNGLVWLVIGGIGGYLLLRHFSSASDNTSRELTSALQDYEGAAKGLLVSRTPTVAADGSLIYESLDPTPSNPIPQFIAVVRKSESTPFELWVENGRPGVMPILQAKDRGKPYLDWSVRVPVARIFFFNRNTGKEVSASELKKSPDWVPWLQDALEDLFAHAFQDACKHNPRYDPWANFFVQAGVNCENKYPVTL